MQTNTTNYSLGITETQIEESKNLGATADFQNLFSFIQLFGALGAPIPSQAEVAHKLYNFDKKKPRLRFENILSGHSSITEIEMAFFKNCLTRIGSKNLLDTLSDDKIRLGKAHILIRNLIAQSPNLDWSKIDPLNAILSLCVGIRQNFYPKIEEYTTRMVVHEEAKTDTYEYPEFESDALKAGDKFFVKIEPTKTCPKQKNLPLVFNFSENEAIHEDGRSVRGIFLYPAREKGYQDSADLNGNYQKKFWRSSKKRNKPWTIVGDEGNYGFLVLGNVGESAEQLLPSGADPLCVSNSDLQHMFGILIQSVLHEDDISFGVMKYTIAK